MQLQPPLPRTIALLLASLGLAAMPAHSMSLGELQLQSFVGQHFRASVPYRLNAGELLNNDCIELLQSRSELPSIGSASVSIQSNHEQSGVLIIESREAIGEPTIAFSLKIACNGHNITRDFTAFLNIAPADNQPTRASTTPRMVSEKSAAPLRDPEQLVIKKPMSLAQLAKRYYPANTPQYPRYLQKLSNANPELNPESELASGTTVVIPELLRSTRKKTVAQPVESGQLRLDASTSTPSTKAAPTRSAEQYAKDLEQKVKLLEDLQQKMQMEVATLNQQLALMKTANAASDVLPTLPTQVASAPTVTPPLVATSSQTASAAAAPHPVRHHVQEDIKPQSDNSLLSWWWLALALIPLLAGLIWSIVRRRNADRFDNNNSSLMTALHERINSPHSPPMHGYTQMSLLHGANQNGIEVREYEGTDLDRVQLMLAQGEIADAIDLLYKSIDDDPEDIERWLMLFRVFRQQGMKTEYANLAQSLRTVVTDEADWELVRNIGAKLDPDNHLYRRTDNPFSETHSAPAEVLSKEGIDLDLHPELTPAAALHRAAMDLDNSPYIPQSLLKEPAPKPIDENLLFDQELPSLDANPPTFSDELVFDIEILPPPEDFSDLKLELSDLTDKKPK